MSREDVIVVGLLCGTVIVGICLLSEQKNYTIELGLNGIKFVKGA